ncbi:MAG: hypothetical protein WCS42_13880 [Verrucomicrobiota bacterium]
MRFFKSTCGAAALFGLVACLHAEYGYPVQHPVRLKPPSAASAFIIYTDQPKQLIKGSGFEIQSDSIMSGNKGLGWCNRQGLCYTPEQAGQNCMGVEIGTLEGPIISPKVADLSWEFWEQQ